MYLDHRIISKIAQVLGRVSNQCMLLDNDGQVVIPEGSDRVFTLPDSLRNNR